MCKFIRGYTFSTQLDKYLETQLVNYMVRLCLLYMKEICVYVCILYQEYA